MRARLVLLLLVLTACGEGTGPSESDSASRRGDRWAVHVVRPSWWCGFPVSEVADSLDAIRRCRAIRDSLRL